MAGINFRDGYEFDPEIYGGESGDLLSLMRTAMQQRRQQQQGTDFGTTPNGEPEYDPGTTFRAQGGLPGRLLSLQAEQSRYQPFPVASEQPSFAPQNPNFRQISWEPMAVRPGRDRSVQSI